MASHPQRPPLYPLHRITVVLRNLRRSQWLTHLHRYHPQPQCRHHVRRLFRHIDQFHDYIRRHRLLPTSAASHPAPTRNHRQEEEEDVLHRRRQYVELRRIHHQQLQESLTRIRHCVRPLQQYLLCHQPGQLACYHRSMNILDIFTSHL